MPRYYRGQLSQANKGTMNLSSTMRGCQSVLGQVPISVVYEPQPSAKKVLSILPMSKCHHKEWAIRHFTKQTLGSPAFILERRTQWISIFHALLKIHSIAGIPLNKFVAYEVLTCLVVTLI